MEFEEWKKVHEDETEEQFDNYDLDKDGNLLFEEYVEYYKAQDALDELLNSKEADDTINYEHYIIAMELVKENMELRNNLANNPGFKEFYEGDTISPKDQKLNMKDFKMLARKEDSEATDFKL